MKFAGSIAESANSEVFFWHGHHPVGKRDVEARRGSPGLHKPGTAIFNRRLAM
jgi:hypothetical protein